MCKSAQRKGLLLISLLFLIPILAASEHRNHGSNQNVTGLFKSLLSIPYRSWQNLLDKTQSNSKKSIENNRETTDLSALAELKRTNNLELPRTTIESSIVPNEDLQVSLFKPFVRESRQGNGCACIPDLACGCACVTTCSALENQCGQTCTRVTVYTAEYFQGPYYQPSLSTSVTTYNNNCNDNCLANYVPPVAIVVGGMVAIALAVAIPLGINPPPVASIPLEPTIDFSVIEDKVPFNSQPFLQNDFPPDGCGNNSVRMEIGDLNRNLDGNKSRDGNRSSDENCVPLLRRGNCRSPQEWVTVNPITLKGRCTPRLCGRERVFVGRDGLCHDIYDPGECQGGRRLYYSPFGDPICDCPIGQYPFPNAEDNCVALFTQGPCRDGRVVGFSPQGQLECMPSQCQSINVGDKALQLLPAEDGRCYALGTQGPCSSPSLLGYDIFKRQMECVDVKNETSPYFTSPEEEALIDSKYNQRSPDFDDFRISLVFDSPVGTNDIGQRRQGSTTGGIFQFPGFLPETLLNPCRPGARREMNFKCTNPLVPNSRTREPLQAVRPAFRCPSDRNLQATGRCVTDNGSKNCGPSFRFIVATQQCRSIF